MNINWNLIRPIGGDIRKGFEEFICQLARAEIISGQKSFVRKGTPDAGVECFWILQDGTEWGWQAKYFPTSFDNNQWSQIDASVKSALEGHPSLAKYFIAFPIDPPDGRVDGQTSLLEKWNAAVAKWEGWARDKGMTVTFSPWWSSDLISRMQKPEHAGMLRFWFKAEEFTDEWFRDTLRRAILNLGSRYTPEHNVELDVSELFHGLAHDDHFKRHIWNIYDHLLAKLKRAGKQEFDPYVNSIYAAFEVLAFDEPGSIDFKPTFETLERAKARLVQAQREEENSLESRQNAGERERQRVRSSSLREAASAIYEAESKLKECTIDLSKRPTLLLYGEPGIGKSHLLADVAAKRESEGKCSLLLLGQHFTTEEDPWTQILKQIKFSGTEYEFLGLINAKAQTMGSRIFVIVDALNEGKGKAFWPEHLPGFIASFEKYPWVGLVMSVRKTYLRLISPWDSVALEGRVIRFEHKGFEDNAYEAASQFFLHYGISVPHFPGLYPEFNNPLYLKIFCESLKNQGICVIPTGYQGISRVISSYTKSINNKLSAQSKFNYASVIPVVQLIISKSVRWMIENKQGYVPANEAARMVAEFQREYSIQGNLFEGLISEGVFSTDLFWKSDGGNVEGIYIAYERINDHFVVEFLLEGLTKETIQQAFQSGGKAFDYVKDEDSCYQNNGIIDALSILLPEQFALDFYEVVPSLSESFVVAESYVKSLVWRKHETVDSNQVEYVNRSVLQYEDTHNQFLDSVVSLSMVSEHYFNAEFLHRNLIGKSLADRDAEWTIYLNENYERGGAVHRIVHWILKNKDVSFMNDQQSRLYGIMLCWLFCSSNRPLRDHATKALVCLLQERIPVLIELMGRFEEINDPYIAERIYCAAYGCALRTGKSDDLISLSKYVYAAIFDKEFVYPHVLLRDYARGIIEYSFLFHSSLEIDKNKIRPPYKSAFPAIPSREEIEKLDIDYKSEGFKDYFWGQNAILSSMEIEGQGKMYGDFGRYVFQAALHDWESVRISDLRDIAIARVFELGYDVEKHGKFDRGISHGDRYDTKVERIGKKYQWIAMHELLAQVADNHRMKDPTAWSERSEVEFAGPWEPYVRDIDPTVIHFVSSARKKAPIGMCVGYNRWAVKNEEWLKDGSDFPDPLQLIAASFDGHDWVQLDGYQNWTEPRKLGHDSFYAVQKNVWYIIKSYIVDDSQFGNIISFLDRKNFMGQWMPKINDRYEVFNREYYWSPAYSFFRKPYYGGILTRELKDESSNTLVGNVTITAESYLWESGRDYSKGKSISMLKPCKLLFDGMNLGYNSVDTELYNTSGELVCFDTAERFQGSENVLWMRLDLLRNFLERNKLRIFWTVLGEKVLLSSSSLGDEAPFPSVSGVYFFQDGNLKGYLHPNN